MGYDYLISIIESLGHFALFLVLCFGLIGLPVPNEAVAMTAGALSENALLIPGLSFLMIWLGVCSAMTFNYSIGRFTNSKLSKWFNKKQGSTGNKFISQADEIIEKYGPFAIPISQFFPFLRHATPYVIGVNKTRFLRFILFAYPTAFIWSIIYFTLGYYVGEQMPDILKTISQYETFLFITLAIVLTIFIYFKVRQHTKKKQQEHIER